MKNFRQSFASLLSSFRARFLQNLGYIQNIVYLYPVRNKKVMSATILRLLSIISTLNKSERLQTYIWRKVNISIFENLFGVSFGL